MSSSLEFSRMAFSNLGASLGARPSLGTSASVYYCNQLEKKFVTPEDSKKIGSLVPFMLSGSGFGGSGLIGGSNAGCSSHGCNTGGLGRGTSRPI